MRPRRQQIAERLLHRTEIIQHRRRVRVLGTRGGLANRQCPLEHRQRLPVLPLRKHQRREIIDD